MEVSKTLHEFSLPTTHTGLKWEESGRFPPIALVWTRPCWQCPPLAWEDQRSEPLECEPIRESSVPFFISLSPWQLDGGKDQRGMQGRQDAWFFKDERGESPQHLHRARKWARKRTSAHWLGFGSCHECPWSEPATSWPSVKLISLLPLHPSSTPKGLTSLCGSWQVRLDSV